MDIVNQIEALLDGYTSETPNPRPGRLLFGRRQLQAFDSRFGPFAAGAASPGPTRAYDGIPIDATGAEDQMEAQP